MKYKYILTTLFLSFNLGLIAQPRAIHVFVALCDNENQGIVPVPESLGNGRKPYSNLYWGAAYGVKTFFKNKSEKWILVKTEKNVSSNILERVVFKHKVNDVYLLADAYDGAEIKQTITDYLSACSGELKSETSVDSLNLKFGGESDLLVYVGHDGLMEFELDRTFKPNNSNKRQAITLACLSKSYFKRYLKQTGAEPLLWTTGLMAPEAYTLEWAIGEWVLEKTNDQIRQKAAEAYHHYQKCGITGAKRLLVTGW